MTGKVELKDWNVRDAEEQAEVEGDPSGWSEIYGAPLTHTIFEIIRRESPHTFARLVHRHGAMVVLEGDKLRHLNDIIDAYSGVAELSWRCDTICAEHGPMIILVFSLPIGVSMQRFFETDVPGIAKPPPEAVAALTRQMMVDDEKAPTHEGSTAIN